MCSTHRVYVTDYDDVLQWVITSEIIPNAARSNGVSLTTGSQWCVANMHVLSISG